MKTHFKRIVYALLLTFGGLMLHQGVSAQTFTTVASAASNGDNCWQLTPNVNNRNGAIWNTNQINLNNPFDLTFHVTQTPGGADGMAFVLQNNGVNVIGGGGSNCGYAGGSITNSIAVELDLWPNQGSGIDDITPDHIAVHQNGVLTNAIAGPVTALSNGANITDGVCRTLRIVWTPNINNFQVWFDGVQRINTTYNIRAPFGAVPNVWFGMTAATGGVSTAQSVCYEFANPGADTSICLNTTLQLNASGGSTYNWAPPVGINSAIIPNPIFTPFFGANTYGYELTVLNSMGCTDVDTIFIDAETVPVANAGADASACPGIASQIGTTGQAGMAYAWSPTTGLDDATLAQPMATPAATTTYTLTITDTTGGANCSSTDQVVVTVEAGATADAGADKSVCAGACDQIGISPAASTTYSWSPTTGLSSSTVSNPTACPTTTTTYVLTSTLTTTGCTEMDTVVVTVNTPPTAFAGNDTAVCEGQCATIGAGTTTGLSYTWSPSTDLSSSTISDPVSCPTATRTYTLLVTETATGCSDTDAVMITLNANPIINAGPDTSICEGTCVQIGAAAIPNMSCIWSPSSGLSSTTVSNPTACPTADICYSVICTNTQTGCNSSDTICITLNPVPTVDAGMDIEICEGDTTNLMGTASAGASVAWTPVAGLADPTSLTTAAYPTSDQAYILTATDPAGCTNLDTMDLTVYPAPTVSFSYGTSQLQVTFTNASAAGAYAWDFGDGDSDTATAPVHTFDTAGTYVVCLQVIDANGCANTLCQNVTVGGVGIAETDLSGAIQLYPNPGTGLFHLEMDGLSGQMTTIRVYSLHGQTMLYLPDHLSTSDRIDLDLRNVSGGIYFVEMKTSTGSAVLKLVKR